MEGKKSVGKEIRTQDRMGTKLKKHHHAHWTLMLDKLHTPESTDLTTHKQGYGYTHTHTKGKRQKTKIAWLSEHCATTGAT